MLFRSVEGLEDAGVGVDDVGGHGNGGEGGRARGVDEGTGELLEDVRRFGEPFIRFERMRMRTLLCSGSDSCGAVGLCADSIQKFLMTRARLCNSILIVIDSPIPPILCDI